MDYSVLDDEQLYDEFKKADIANRLATSPEWALVKEAANRIVERAVDKFATATDPSDMGAILELQLTIRKYKHGLFAEVEMLAQTSEIYFDELAERGVLRKP